MREAPPNTIGLTAMAAYNDLTGGRRLDEQLAERGIDVDRIDLPIVGMGGSAQVLCYTSPKTGDPVAILVIPHQTDVDQYGEDYFYFASMTTGQAMATDWITVYDEITRLDRD